MMFRTLRKLAASFSALVVFISGCVLFFGWVLDISAMRQLYPSLPGMAISTAVGLFGCSLCVLHEAIRPQARQAAYRTILGFAFLGLAVSDLALVAAVPGRGVDQILFGFADERAGIYMAPATAICLALAASCLLIPRRRADFFNGDLFALLAAAGLVITVLALTGFVFDSRALHEVFVFSAMALHTAIGFFILFLALLLLRPTWGWMRVIVGPGPGSAMLRRTLPYVVLGPFLFCGLTLLAVDAGMFNVNFRLSVLALSGTSCLIVLLFWSALRENADAKDLLKTNQRLRVALDEREILLQEVYHRVKNNLQFIDAMLALETGGLGDSAVASRLTSIRTRVHALAHVHELLVGSKDLATLNLRDFLESLCANQANGNGFDGRGIRIETQIDSVLVDLDIASPIGLMVTELISNASKHAFPDGRSGVIRVTVVPTGNHAIVLSVRDNGVGRGGSAESEERVGSMILRSLAAQLGAEMKVIDSDGLQVDLTIPLQRHGRLD
jgi:two-component sensor histidine kinase